MRITRTLLAAAAGALGLALPTASHAAGTPALADGLAAVRSVDSGEPARPAAGRHLRVLRSNPRYFTDGTGKAVLLTGSHVWWNLTGPDRWSACGDAASRFDFDRYLDFLERHGHNFIRLWRVEHTRWESECGGTTTTAFQPWLRTGPGAAHDGLPKFDLTRLDPAYFNRLRDRVAAAQQRGIYVSVMLFEGWSLHSAGEPWNWTGHPFHPDNNVNGIDGDADGDGDGTDIVTLANRDVLAIQKAYVRTVVETVNGFDNVLYEIANEAGHWSIPWQYHMIRFVKALQRERGEKRPVGMTFMHPGGSNRALYRSPADWISPFGKRYMKNPPPANGRKVIVSDNDHHCGLCGDATFPWRSFLRGLNPIYMDDLDLDGPDPARDSIRAAMGQTRLYAERIRLAASRPRPELASTRYALAAANRQFLVYAPKGGRFTVDLRKAQGRYSVEWFRPETGRTLERGKRRRGGAVRSFAAPFPGSSVLLLRRAG